MNEKIIYEIKSNKEEKNAKGHKKRCSVMIFT